MSDNKNNPFQDIINFMAHGGAVPKVAMTLGSKPSFTCSYIHSDQFFYEDETQDDVFMQFEDALDSDVEERMIPNALLQAKETSEGFITLGDPSCGLPLTDDLAALCTTAFDAVEVSDIQEAVALLQGSDLAREYLEFADKAAIGFDTSATIDRMVVDYAANTVTLPQNLSVVETALCMMRGIRAIQMKDVRDLMKNPDRAVLINRAFEAELVSVPVHVAWELKLSGRDDVWSYVSYSASADLAYAFGHRASDDFRAIRDGRSAIAAFDQWFYSGRTRKADRALIQTLLSSSEEVAEVRETTNTQAIEALRIIGARCATGRNYLVDHFMTLLEDGFYGEVRDRSNANFMWFVKFERSFRETEERLEEKRSVSETDTIMPENGAVILAFPKIKKAKVSKIKTNTEMAKVHTLRV